MTRFRYRVGLRTISTAETSSADAGATAGMLDASVRRSRLTVLAK
jgi:hypothetical protein